MTKLKRDYRLRLTKLEHDMIKEYRTLEQNTETLKTIADKYFKQASKTEFVEKDDKAYVSGQATSLDELLTQANVDLKIWEVETYEIKNGSWDVTMADRDQDLIFEKDAEGKQLMTGYAKRNGQVTKTNEQFSIKVRLRKRKDYLENTIKQYIQDVPKFNLFHYVPKYKQDGEIALELALLDAHFGKLSWIYETNYRNYDTVIASEDYEYAVDEALAWGSRENLGKIVYIVGQDLFHIDNMKNHTTNGDHTMDVDGRIPKIYRKIFQIVTESIYKARQVAPVEVIWSPGNHDYLASMMLCFALEEHFRNDKFVTVDISKEKDGLITRKARLWGNLLVGWTHRIKGRENTWGNELAQAFPELWGQSKFREWHCGDQHLKKTTKLTPEFTSGGVLVRQLTALSPVDRWHFENLFTDAVPGGEAFLWCKDRGVFDNRMMWTGQYNDYRDKLVKK